MTPVLRRTCTYVLGLALALSADWAFAQAYDPAQWAPNIRELHWQRQWALEATASSSYNETGSWSVEQVLGPPDTAGYGDHGTAWAPKNRDGGVEWLELTYRWPVIPDSIQIIESCGAGAVKRVQVQPLDGGAWVTVLEQQPRADERIGPIINVVDASEFGQATKRVRVEIDTGIPEWNEIDAVALMGTYVIGAHGSGLSTGAYRLWATGAQASSSYSNVQEKERYSPWQTTGLPNTPPGDYGTAWAPQFENAGMEWLQVGAQWVISATEMNIHENCGPGFVRRIEAKDARNDQWVTVWEGADPTEPPAGVLSVPLHGGIHTNTFRIHVDTSVPGWNEIDAVEIVGNPVE